MIGSATKIGEEIKYTLDPISNISSINFFYDDVLDETSNKYFDKYFRVAIEGLYFTDYKKLSNFNLKLIGLDPIRTYVIEVLYKRAGTDNTGDLILNDFQINVTDIVIDNGYEYDHSNFAKFFESNDIDVEKWTLNVLKKVFEYGQLATYILRGQNVSEIIDDNNIISEERQFENLNLHFWDNGNQSEF